MRALLPYGFTNLQRHAVALADRFVLRVVRVPERVARQGRPDPFGVVLRVLRVRVHLRFRRQLEARRLDRPSRPASSGTYPVSPIVFESVAAARVRAVISQAEDAPVASRRLNALRKHLVRLARLHPVVEVAERENHVRRLGGAAPGATARVPGSDTTARLVEDLRRLLKPRLGERLRVAGALATSGHPSDRLRRRRACLSRRSDRGEDRRVPPFARAPPRRPCPSSFKPRNSSVSRGCR